MNSGTAFGIISRCTRAQMVRNAALTFGLAVAVKFLPIVLLPLYWERIRLRDAALAAGAVALLYAPFVNHGRIPTGSLGTYGQTFRSNGPVFGELDRVASPQLLAGLVRFVGFATSRRHLFCAPPRRIPLVSALAVAMSDVGLDVADHLLDTNYYSHLCHVALEQC